MLIPGERMFTSDVIHMVCVKRKDLIKYVAKINDWKSRKVALINLKNMQAIFQNFQPRWTQSKIEKFLLNRHLPSTLRDDLDTKIFYLKWDQILLLMTTSKTLKKER